MTNNDHTTTEGINTRSGYGLPVIGDGLSVKSVSATSLARLSRQIPFADAMPNTHSAVLCYHSVGDPGEFGNVSRERFERDISYLNQRYDIVDLETAVQQGQDSHRKQVVVTFDDGYDNFYTEALPVLESYEAPATVFVVANGVTSGSVVPDFGNTMGIKRLRELVGSDIVTIGNHTRTHQRLTDIDDPDQLRDEIVGAQADLEAALGVDINAFSYPNGAYDRQVLEVVSESHDIAVTGTPGVVRPSYLPYRIPRIDAHHPHAEVMFQTTDFYQRLRSLFT